MAGRETSVALCEGRLCLADDMVDAEDEQILRKRTFLCTTCPEEHRVYYNRTKNPRYKKGAFFSHGPNTNDKYTRDNDTNAQGHARGESENHLQGKFLLQNNVGMYHFITKKCENCDEITVIETGLDHLVLVEKRMIVNESNLYVYDTVLVSGLNKEPICVMEVYNTHETSQDKIKKTHTSGLQFAEFTVEDLENFRKHLVSPGGISGVSYMLTNLKPEVLWCAECRDVVRREVLLRQDKHVKSGFAEYNPEMTEEEIQELFDDKGRRWGEDDEDDRDSRFYFHYAQELWESFEPYAKDIISTEMDTRLYVNYKEKDIVKKLGAQWNPYRKYWYVPTGSDITLFMKWLKKSEDFAVVIRAKQLYKFDHRECRNMLRDKKIICLECKSYDRLNMDNINCNQSYDGTDTYQDIEGHYYTVDTDEYCTRFYIQQ